MLHNVNCNMKCTHVYVSTYVCSLTNDSYVYAQYVRNTLYMCTVCTYVRTHIAMHVCTYV